MNKFACMKSVVVSAVMSVAGLSFAETALESVPAPKPTPAVAPVLSEADLKLAHEIECQVLSNRWGAAECLRCTCNNKQESLQPMKVIVRRWPGMTDADWRVRAQWDCAAHGYFGREFRLQYVNGVLKGPCGEVRTIAAPINARGMDKPLKVKTVSRTEGASEDSL